MSEEGPLLTWRADDSPCCLLDSLQTPDRGSRSFTGIFPQLLISIFTQVNASLSALRKLRFFCFLMLAHGSFCPVCKSLFFSTTLPPSQPLQCPCSVYFSLVSDPVWKLLGQHSSRRGSLLVWGLSSHVAFEFCETGDCFTHLYVFRVWASLLVGRQCEC